MYLQLMYIVQIYLLTFYFAGGSLTSSTSAAPGYPRFPGIQNATGAGALSATSSGAGGSLTSSTSAAPGYPSFPGMQNATGAGALSATSSGAVYGKAGAEVEKPPGGLSTLEPVPTGGTTEEGTTGGQSPAEATSAEPTPDGVSVPLFH